ncbi:MAG: energy transducer TonB, partial [Muribaculaceae bacterium]|nr:energy transducer TonB [Muribaculaceae bacterium]
LGIRDSVAISTAQSKESKDDDYYSRCFDYPDKYNHMAYYRGGDDSLISFLRNNLVYPQKCAEDSIEGTVILQFRILSTGKVDSVRAVRKAHPLLDQEAIRVAALLDNWIPAVRNGEPVNCWYTLPIKFRFNPKK